jgi:hypothetical protein
MIRPHAILSAAAFLALGAGAHGQLPPTIGPQVRIDPGGGTKAANETSIAVSPANPMEIIAGWNDWRRSGAAELINSGYAVSVDGGQSWTDMLVRPPAAFQSSTEGDPMTAWDPRTGTLWAGAIAFSGTGGIYVARKDPGSTSFEPSVMAIETFGADKCWMAAGPRPGLPETTRVYITFNQGVMWSDDLGDTWTSPSSLGSGLGFLPRVGPAGELYVAYWDLDTKLLLQRSLDGGQTFTTHEIATRMDSWGTNGLRFPGTFRVAPLVYIAVDPASGALYAAYFDTTSVVGGQHNIDIYFTRSLDQGTTWTTPTVVNGDASPPGDQFFSWIEVDEDGRLHMVYYDTRHTPQDDNVIDGMIDAYYAWSVNGGDSWQEYRLTPAAFNSDDDGLDRDEQFIGDYLGITVAGRRAFPVYLDTSAGDPDIFTHVIELPLVGDTNGDDLVDALDFLAVIAQWGPCPGPDPCPADFNADGVINALDFLILIARWST